MPYDRITYKSAQSCTLTLHIKCNCFIFSLLNKVMYYLDLRDTKQINRHYFSEGAKKTKDKPAGAPRSPRSPVRSHPGQINSKKMKHDLFYSFDNSTVVVYVLLFSLGMLVVRSQC